MTEERSIGYEEGYQAGWNAAMDAKPEQPAQQEPFCYHDGRNIVGKEYAGHSDVFPLYTHPQAREPLTDEEFISMLDSTGLVVDPELAFEIKALAEAAHGIGEPR